MLFSPRVTTKATRAFKIPCRFAIEWTMRAPPWRQAKQPDPGLKDGARYEAAASQWWEGQLEPFAEQHESRAEAVTRLSGYAVRAAKQAADLAPIGALGRTALRTINTVDFIRQYGLHGLAGLYLRQEIMQSAQLLYRVSSQLDVQLSMSNLVLGLYYRAAMQSGARGEDPDMVRNQWGCNSESANQQVAQATEWGPFGLFYAYQDTLTCQRLLSHHGYDLILAENSGDTKEKPVFFLAANRERKRVVLLVRGSQSAVDWLANVEFNGCQMELADGSVHQVHAGIYRRALWLDETVGPVLEQFDRAGYQTVITGHSHGAGVGALLATMRNVRRAQLGFQERKVMCVGYGCPPVVDEGLAGRCEGWVSQVVLERDVVPRISLKNVEELMERLAREQHQWQHHATTDWEAIQDRVGNLWAPRTRTLSTAKPKLNLNPTKPQPPPPTTQHQSRHGHDQTHGHGLDPRLVPPGGLVLLYQHRGFYRVGELTSDATSMRELEPSDDMTQQHSTSEYWEALCEVHAGLGEPPQWERFGSRSECSCCDAEFSWGSSGQSVAQTYMDTHNCHQCGKLVCAHCSEHRQPILDLRRAVRVCDKCFYSTPVTQVK
eukprot:TRINITY_DN10682_c0_g1_i1.p1 TRINITY_DN10682_c0_g1~~TRINITY_DN10682_c0_g1_i1.p1  ORF type:complete len:604 (-),score=122.00 TRINITY_DN10682_c0_g1_i1:112-1923(-)